MQFQISDLIADAAGRAPEAIALKFGSRALPYEALAAAVDDAAGGFLEHGLARHERVAVYLDKRVETVAALFGASRAGGVFVPVNPVLKAPQVAHILKDCGVRVLVTSSARLHGLAEVVPQCHELRAVVLVDRPGGDAAPPAPESVTVLDWAAFVAEGRASGRSAHRAVDTDMAAILYTSGSTGLPKGVVLSHRNMLAGAHSVATYLENRPDDRILSVLPLSFDAGFSQLTTAFAVGARVVLMNYLLAKDVATVAEQEGITGITGIPPLWIPLSQLDWTPPARDSLRYFANTGGAMPRATLDRLRALFPRARPYLMYGLTEAFRSTFLPPEEVDRRPDSIGMAVPNAEVMVVRPDGTECAPGEPGELVHRGAFVAMGYWNDPERTAQRFRPAPAGEAAIPLREMAVWSGDTVRRDDEGFLYFVGRRDEMIKTSGYRVSPTELEEVLYASGTVGEVVALGIPHPVLGHGVLVLATPPRDGGTDPNTVLAACRANLPAFMVPHRVMFVDALPRNANGKFDRKALSEAHRDLFQDPRPEATS